MRIFGQIKRDYGLPNLIRTDNCPEFLGQTFKQWSKDNDVDQKHIQPGKPNHNAFIERFNQTLREDVFDRHLFSSLEDGRGTTHWRMIDDNESRPLDRLNGATTIDIDARLPRFHLLSCRLDREAWVLPMTNVLPIHAARSTESQSGSGGDKPEAMTLHPSVPGRCLVRPSDLN